MEFKTVVTIRSGYVALPDRIWEHYMKNFPRRTNFVVSYLSRFDFCDIYGNSVLHVRTENLKNVYQVPDWIPDIQVVKYVERKLWPRERDVTLTETNT